MYSMSPYFDFGMRTTCGFPLITVEGTVEDWESIATRVKEIRDIVTAVQDAHMMTWVDALLSLVDEFILAAKGTPNRDFWRTFYDEREASGGPYISGHLTDLFPYVRRHGGWRKNPRLKSGSGHRFGSGLTASDFDSGISRVDIKWDYMGSMREVQLHGGLVGVSISEGSPARPECGWAMFDVTDVREAA